MYLFICVLYMYIHRVLLLIIHVCMTIKYIILNYMSCFLNPGLCGLILDKYIGWATPHVPLVLILDKYIFWTPSYVLLILMLDKYIGLNYIENNWYTIILHTYSTRNFTKTFNLTRNWSLKPNKYTLNSFTERPGA